MLLFNVIRSNALPIASQDFITIISNTTRSFCILELDAEGAGTASAYTEMGIYRVGTAGTTGGGAITPAPVNPAQAAFGGVVDTTWTGQPTIGALIHTMPVNSNGQRYFWRAMPNLSNAIWSPGGAVAAGTISIRPITISGNITLRAQIGEIQFKFFSIAWWESTCRAIEQRLGHFFRCVGRRLACKKQEQINQATNRVLGTHKANSTELSKAVS